MNPSGKKLALGDRIGTDTARNPFAQFRQDRPRLMATQELLDRAREAMKDTKDTEGQRIRTKVLNEAQEALKEEMPRRDPKDPKGPNWNFLAEARNTLRRFQALGMAWFFDSEDPKYLKRIKDELAVVCGFYDWNPGHFLDTAEMTHAVAIAYDWFHAKLDHREKEMCVKAIMEKGLRRGYEHLIGMPKPAPWTTQNTNWDIVCNAGLMIGALSIMREKGTDGFPEKVFQRCLEPIPTGFKSYSPEGGWDEGPGYWAYATEYAAYLLTSLYTTLGHDYGLADLPGFCEGGLFRMHSEGGAVSDRQHRKFFNFSDCEEERRGSWCMRWLSLRTGQTMFNWMAHKDGQARPMDLFWYVPKEAGEPDGLELNMQFKGRANVAMLRGAWGGKAGRKFRPWTLESTEEGGLPRDPRRRQQPRKLAWPP
jgi:hypothetical protein